MSDGNTNDSVFIQNLFTSRDNFTQGNVLQAEANAAAYVGQSGRIWWNPVPNAFYYSDGNTPGGIIISGGSTGNGIAGGPANSIQTNAGNGTFVGSSNLTFDGTLVSVIGNVQAINFLGNGSQLTGLPLTPPGGSNTQVQYNNNNTFAGDPNFTWNASTSTLTVTNIVANVITGGPGVAGNTQVLFNDAGNVVGDSDFTYNKTSNVLTMTGSAYLGNLYAQSNNTSNLGSATSRFNNLWLGSGNINLVDQSLNTLHQIYALNGNIVMEGGIGLEFGDFAMFNNTIATQNPTSNIKIGLVGDSAYVDIERPLAVNSTGGGLPVFVVEQNGTVSIFNANAAANTSGALNIVGSSARTYQNVTNSGGMIHVTSPDNSAARVTVDAFGTVGNASAFAQFIGRAGRGNSTTPLPVQAGDIMARYAGVGWIDDTNKFLALGKQTPTAIEMVATQNYSAGNTGSQINLYTAPINTDTRTLSAIITANGLALANVAQSGSGTAGITFVDGSFQNTAYSPTTSVQSLAAGSGISISATTGNITITNTGVLGIIGTTNQISITGNVGNIVTLGTPQDIAPTSNVQFYSLTVNDLSILGNVSNVIPSVVDGPIVYVANTATTYSGINDSGLYSGNNNVLNSYYAAILYDTSSNTWKTNIGNSVGITAGNIYTGNITANGTGHFGNASNDYDFPNALIQGDINIDSYGQFVLKNHAQTANSSADIVAVANNGDDVSYYIDMGINSNVYANVDYIVTGANDGYLYVNGGNLVIGTQTAGKVIRFITGGTDNLNKIRGTLSDTGLSMVGNITANNFIGNTVAASIVSASGNVTGGNLISLGQICTAGNITGLNVNADIFSATGNIVGPNVRVTGTLSAVGNVVAGNITTSGIVSSTGNIIAANIAAGNITSAIISTTGNITGPNITATIMLVSSLLSVTGNIQAGNLLTVGVVSATGNVIANTYIGNGSQLTGITVTKIGNGTSEVNIPSAGGNANISINGTGNVAVFATTGAYVTGVISATGNIRGANINTAGLISSTGNIITSANLVTVNTVINSSVSTGGNVIGANINTSGLISATGNVTGGNLIGQNLTAGRVAIVGSGKEVATDADFTYNSTTNALSLAGNITANYFFGNGSGLTNTVGGSKYYGSFLNTVTQTNTSPGNALPMTLDTSDSWNSGVSIGSPTPNSRIIINNPGVYNLQFSAQLDKTDAGQDVVDIWLSQDGVNVPNTNTTVTLTGNDDKVVAAWNFMVQTTTANSYFELYWTSADSQARILAQGTQINPTRPATPSLIVTVTQA